MPPNCNCYTRKMYTNFVNAEHLASKMGGENKGVNK